MALAKILAYHGERINDTSYDWETITRSRYSLTELAFLDRIAKALNIQYTIDDKKVRGGDGYLTSYDDNYDYITSDGSSAPISVHFNGAESAFKNEFKYPTAKERYAGNGFNKNWLDRILRSNLNAGLPVALSGGDHAFVADGYGFIGEIPYFHLDMGWLKENYWWNLTSPIITPKQEYYDKDYGAFIVNVFEEISYNIHPTEAFDKLVTGRVTMMGAGVGAEVKITLPNGKTATQTTEDGIYVFYISGTSSGKATITASSTVGMNAGSTLGSLGIPSALLQGAIQTSIKPVTVTLTINEESNYCCDIALKSSTPTPTSATAIYVKFDANGGTLPKGKKMAVQTMMVGKSAKLRKNEFTRAGYVFIGWSKKKTDAIAFNDEQSVKNIASAGKTVSLYAQWAKASYKVKFLANGGKGTMAMQKMKYGKKAKLKANKFKRKGCVFMGWAKSKADAKKGKIAYKNKKAVKNLTTTGSTVKLYAVWKRR